MKINKYILLMVLAMCLLLSACTVSATVQETAEPTVAATEAVEEATEAAAVLEEESSDQGKLHYQPVLTQTVLPQSDEATGTLCFYLNGKTIYAGCPVADLIEVGFHSYTDLTTVVQPWHMSEVVRVLIDLPDTEEDDEPYLFFVAINASDEPCMISECLIYSITVNCQSGISFGSGQEREPFVSGVSTRDEIVGAYGEPDETVSGHTNYEEIYYYEPFSGVSFSFFGGKVRQISTYYSANVFGGLEGSVDFGLDAGATEKDCLILMSQYLDVTPYLEGGEVAEGTGILTKFNDYFEINNSRIQFGCMVSELPSPFLEDLNDLAMVVDRNYYIRTGRNDPEEFFVINHKGQVNSRSNNLLIKGIVTESCHYSNWGVDNSDFHSFNCQGVTENSTIDDVLELFGQPAELICTNSERTCFAWMHYETEEGDTLRIRVDPMLNQVVEVHMSKYFEKQRSY